MSTMSVKNFSTVLKNIFLKWSTWTSPMCMFVQGKKPPIPSQTRTRCMINTNHTSHIHIKISSILIKQENRRNETKGCSLIRDQLNLLYNHCHRVKTHLQLINITLHHIIFLQRADARQIIAMINRNCVISELSSSC
jgi:hypothetical protein